jgi:hypothetical protein
MTISKIKIEHLWVITVLMGVFIFLNTLPINMYDFWWHIAIGRDITTSGEIPIYDQYSYTMAGESYPSYQMFWLPEMVLFKIFNFGGAELVVLANALIILTSYGLLLWLCYRVSGNLRIAALATILGILFGIHNWTVRPQVFSYLIGVLYLIGIYEYRRKPHYAWLAIFPLGMILWANSHGSFPIGLVLLGIWFADEVWQWIVAWWKKEPERSFKSLLAPMVAIGLATLGAMANPRGLGIVSYVLTLSSNDIVQNMVTEWAPTTLRSQVGTIYIIGFLLCTAILIFSPKRPTFFQFISYLVFVLLLFRTLRGAVWFGLVMAPIMASHFVAIGELIRAKWQPRTDGRGKPAVNITYIIILVILGLLSLPWFRDLLSSLPFEEKFSVIAFETPENATEYLIENNIKGKIFNDMGFGSYLIWKAQPDYPVFVDPRIELYPADIWEEYIIIINALPGWEEYLERYEVELLFLNPVHQPKLIKAAQESDYWVQIYADETSKIFSHQ